MRDRLTGRAVLTQASVTSEDLDARGFSVSKSRWVWERIRSAPSPVAMEVRAAGYLPSTVLAGGPDHPPVPASGTDPPPIVDVELTPRTGYPFPARLTRVIAEAVLALPDGSTPPAADAEVEVTPRYVPPAGPPPAPILTRTSPDGQLTMWFLPRVVAAPPAARLPSSCDIDVRLTYESVLYEGSASVALDAHRTTGAPRITLVP